MEKADWKFTPIADGFEDCALNNFDNKMRFILRGDRCGKIKGETAYVLLFNPVSTDGYGDQGIGHSKDHAISCLQNRLNENFDRENDQPHGKGKHLYTSVIIINITPVIMNENQSRKDKDFNAAVASVSSQYIKSLQKFLKNHKRYDQNQSNFSDVVDDCQHTLIIAAGGMVHEVHTKGENQFWKNAKYPILLNVLMNSNVFDEVAVFERDVEVKGFEDATSNNTGKFIGCVHSNSSIAYNQDAGINVENAFNYFYSTQEQRNWAAKDMKNNL
ncbi:MAG: hypothetical protein LKG24_03970 [Lacticaseibacillus songhuajiangensis]|jgi:hypothetical protein|nr:hypothetical protein [Lacticaseibacillus songhuajiangensis]